MSESKLPKNWKIEKVSNIANLIRGINYKKETASNNSFFESLPILRANNINGDLNFEDLVYVPKSLIKSEQLIKKDDIIFAMSSGSKHLVGKTAVAKNDFKGSYGAFCALLRINEGINKKYVSYIFKGNNYRKLISEIAKGTSINNLKREHILDFEFPLPPLETQHAIVSKIEELFSELDKGIAELKTAQKQLKTYRQSVLKFAFEGKLTNENVKEGELPDGWERKTFNDVIDISKEKYKPNNSESKFYVGLEHIEKNLGVLTAECGFENIKTIKNKFNVGEILYGKLRPYLNKVYLAKENGVCSTDILVLKTKKNCNAQFLTHLMLGVDFVNTMSENTSGVNLPRVSTKFILEYPINLPPIEEQNRIVQEIESRLSVADKMEQSIQESLQKAEALRQSILKKAFCGELV